MSSYHAKNIKIKILLVSVLMIGLHFVSYAKMIIMIINK